MKLSQLFSAVSLTVLSPFIETFYLMPQRQQNILLLYKVANRWREFNGHFRLLLHSKKLR